MSLTITTNNQPRFLLNWFDLTDKERSEFDYLKTEEEQSEHQFFRYRGWTYDLGEFMRAPEELKPWHGYHGDSYFSGILVKYVGDESVICATYYS